MRLEMYRPLGSEICIQMFGLAFGREAGGTSPGFHGIPSDGMSPFSIGSALITCGLQTQLKHSCHERELNYVPF